MLEGLPSVTALRAATYRAQHQLKDRPLVFEDPLAVAIVSAAGPMQCPRLASVRAFISCRHRYTEDALKTAVAAGIAQYVILGAGLDTFAYRNAASPLRVFEIDHPSTQSWKRSLLSSANIAIPANLTYVPVDFTRQSLAGELPRSGYDPSQPAFFSWLGVTPYLTEDAVLATLSCIHAFHPRNRIVFDYLVARADLSLRGGLAHRLLSRYVSRLGEPLRSGFSAEALRARLLAIGFREIDDLDCPRLNDLYFPRPGGVRIAGRLTRIVSACG